ncbi:response regulator [Paenibacillus sp. GCM10027627]|uniref:response regulator n=1 Tax=unclassified Paenibacillus TaxID=185978 RepID=UPI0036301B32
MKLLIVDDEVIIRTGLSTVIPWGENGYEVLAPAASAEEAIARLASERPDIILTDIQMTGLTGLDLAREAKRLLPDAEVIILTGYDQFEYARKAIIEGVGDYLLKTSRPDEIMNAVGGARQRIVMRGDAAAGRGGSREKVLEKLLSGEEPDYATIREGTRWLPKLKLQEPSQYLACVIGAEGWGEGSAGSELLLFAVHNVISELMDGEATLQGDYILLIVRQEEGRPSIADLELELERIELKLKCKLQASAGEPAEELKYLSRSVAMATDTFLYRGLLPNNRFIRPQEICGRKGGRSASSPEERRRLSELLAERDEKRLGRWVTELFDAEIGNEQATPESLSSYLNDLLRFARERAEQMLGESGADGSLPGADEISVKDATVKGGELLLTALLELAAVVQDASTGQKMPHMNRALAYIDEHLDEELTLQQAAQRVQLTPHHFSEVFQRETGLPYKEYVAKTRLERAKELLEETDAAVSEIADRTGYGSLDDFNQLFVAAFGMTPWDYRRKKQEG